MTTAAAAIAAAVVLAACGTELHSVIATATPSSTTTPATVNPEASELIPAAASAPTSAPVLPRSVGRSPATMPPPSSPAVPVRIEVAAVGIDAPIDPVGVRSDGQMDLPPDPDVVGWYRFGPTPGDAAGSVVLGGHLDSKTYGVGQLARLRDVEVGAEIVVRLTSGGVGNYTVAKVERFEKPDLPVAELFRRDGDPVLVLVTCGGDFDADVGRYQENLVVTAVPS